MASEATARLQAARSADRASFEREADRRQLEPSFRTALAASFDAPPCGAHVGLAVRLEHDATAVWATPAGSRNYGDVFASAPSGAALVTGVTAAVREPLGALLGPSTRVVESEAPVRIVIALRAISTGTVTGVGVVYPTFDIRPVVTIERGAQGAPSFELPTRRPDELMILRHLSRPATDGIEEVLRQHATTVPRHVVLHLRLGEVDARLLALPRRFEVRGRVRTDECGGRIVLPPIELTLDPIARTLSASVLDRSYDAVGRGAGLVATGSARVDGTCPGTLVAETWTLDPASDGTYTGVFTTEWALPPCTAPAELRRPGDAHCGVLFDLTARPVGAR
jgi:hypothetical protein